MPKVGRLVAYKYDSKNVVSEQEKNIIKWKNNYRRGYLLQ